jgi:hypothetical protein
MEKRKDIVSFKPSDNYKSVRIVYVGLNHKDTKDRMTPIYYFVFNKYDPVSHRIDRIKSISSKKIFSGVHRKQYQENKRPYDIYLGFTNLLDANVLNDFITEDQKIRALVHYNFLSSFAHLTKKSTELLKRANLASPYGPHTAIRTRHLLAELNLLYVINILEMFIHLFVAFFSETEHRLKNKIELLANSNKMMRKYD